jgi:class 3 adenylate cyclase
MSNKRELIKEIESIISEKFLTEDVDYVPDITNPKLTFGNFGLQFDATVLYIDMRGSTEILEKHNNPIVAKIHMAYFKAITHVVSILKGEIRSFNGDSMLVFFQGPQTSSINIAVKAALQIKYIISNKDGINPILEKYSAIDFGIGIDYGKILCTKIGLPRNQNNQDLIWIGRSVNKSTKISCERKSPNHIGISSLVFNNLFDNLKFGKSQFNQKINIWSSGFINYNNKLESIYITNFHWPLI